VRGYCGLVFWRPKKGPNIGGALRSAHAFGADVVMTIGARYTKYESADTAKAALHVPLFHFTEWESFVAAKPTEATLVAAEFTDDAANLVHFTHPERGLYLFGPEDGSLPKEVVTRCSRVVRIPTRYCLNLASTATVVLYDRAAKAAA
jgi:tRNA(Leu) C34 or U34 (ribose-2'-O)-methylase TrmL